MACLSSSISSNLHSGFVCEARRRRRREAAGSLQALETQFGEICSGSGSCLVSSAAAVAIRRRTSVRGRGGQSRVLTRKKNGIGSFANRGEEAAVAAAAALRLPGVFFVGESSAVLLRRRLGYYIVEDDDDDKKNKRDRRKQKTVIMSSSIDSEPSKIVEGAGGAILEDVPHLTDWLPGLPTYANPLKHNPAYAAVRQYFVEETDVVAKDVVVNINKPSGGIYFRRAGPREKIYFKSEDVKAAIVTCGGLCPGLNTVIREIVCGLWTQYGVREIYGIVGGYRGFYSRNTIDLNPKVVNDIHKRGGTILRTSRGGHETSKIVDSIEDRGINQVYIIGGDGTQKGAWAIHKECVRRGLEVVVAGIPKTIDNDIDIIDKSFGFDTAVEEAQRAINAAHVEAESAQNGIGLVKLMGRYSGYIAMYATLASRDVDLCLIPEVPFYLEGPGGLYEFVEQRLRENGHMVIVVAEGAGQELMAESMGSHDSLIDASGNRLLLDVGLWLCQNLKEHFAKAHPTFKEPLNLKYIDPTYMVRAIPSNASDNVYCTLLAHSAIHGAMAGYCGFTAGPVNNRHCYIPIPRVTRTQRHVNVADRMWARLLSGTNQPDFLLYKVIIEEKRRAKALMQAEKMKKDAAEQTSKSPTTSPSQDSPTTVTNGNGSINNETMADNSKTQIVTGDRQFLPVTGSSLVTSPVPGEPTANVNQEAP